MKFSRFFRVLDLPEGEDDVGGWGVKVEPSKHLQNMHPHEAIAELQVYVDGVKELLTYYQQVFTDEELEKPENLGKLKKAAFELDVSNSYLSYLKKHYQTVH
jgi:hypothetical protein